MDPSLVQGTRKIRIKSEPEVDVTEEEAANDHQEEESFAINDQTQDSDNLPGPSASFSRLTSPPQPSSLAFPSTSFDMPIMKLPSRHDQEHISERNFYNQSTPGKSTNQKFLFY